MDDMMVTALSGPLPEPQEAAGPGTTQGTPPLVRALMMEAGLLLKSCLREGKRGSIDLMRLPMSEADLAALDATLGRGEITITLQVDGESVVRETAHPGLWLIEHRDRSGRLLARLIEVGAVPGIVLAGKDDMAGTVERLTGPASGKGL